MYWAQFYQPALGSGELIEACGDRAVIILDGRESSFSHHTIASQEAAKRGYWGYKLCKGDGFSRVKHETGIIRVSKSEHIAYTLDGSVIWRLVTDAQGIGDAVTEYMANNRKPHIGYTRTNRAMLYHYPFTVWQKGDNGYIRIPCQSFEEVCKVWGAVMNLTKAEQFFYNHAGVSWNPQTQTRKEGQIEGAKALARAEAWVTEEGYSFSWEIDLDSDSSDFKKRGPVYNLWQCTMHSPTGKVVQALGGIDFGPDGEPYAEPYRRVVEAELAAEQQKCGE